MTDKEFIEDFKKYACNNYNNGYDYIVECWSDDDLLRELAYWNGDAIKFTASMQEIVDLYLQKQQEQRADVIDFGETPNF
jgi:hypothetical protein